MIRAIFKGACPNCGGEIDDERLALMLPCRACLPEEEAAKLRELAPKLPPLQFKLEVLKTLERLGRLKAYSNVVELDLKLREVDELFNRITGSRLWSAQRTWAKRVLRGKSFAIIAPTGVGKTMFGMIMSLYLASKGKRCYIVLPTSVLVKQVAERLEAFRERAGLQVRVVAYLAKSNRAKKELLEIISSGEFEILVTTSQFLARHFDLLRNHRFDFIFVDDVDALLRASRNIDRVLMLLGFREPSILRALELIRLKRQAAFFALLARQEETYRERLEETLSKIRELSEEISREIEETKPGVLVVSSATGRPRGLRVRLFRELLGFEAGSRSELIRNIADLYVEPKASLEEETLRLVKLLGDGGLVFVALDKGSEYAAKLCEYLKEHGIRAELVVAGKRGDQIERFANGKLDVLVGMATYYGLLVRGLDLPHRVRYAIFVGVPKLRFSLEAREAHPFRIASLLSDLRDYLEGREKDEVDRLVGLMMRYLRELPPARIEELREALETGKPLEGRMARVLEIFKRGYEKARELLEREDIRRKLAESPYIDLVVEPDGRLRVLVPDAMTYIQASGRTSRMFAGGISKGIAVVIVDNRKVFEGLMRKTRWLIEDIEWKRLDEVDLKELLAQVDRDREVIRKLMEGRVSVEFKDPVRSALLIVESPSKARTIASFFGRPSRRRIGRYLVYEVSTGEYLLSIVACGGHVYDLVMTPEDFYGTRKIGNRFVPVYDTIRRCLKCGEQFVGLDACPVCKSTEFTDKREVIEMLRDLAREVDVVLLGTDPDTEGEKISWDLAMAIRPYANELRRIEFHEVTKRAIQEALKNPREINIRLVEAQIVRRIEDRWIGFALSEELWREFNRRGLSAGRVQTPVLGWVIQRYEEFRKSVRDYFYLTLQPEGREEKLRIVLDDFPVEGSAKETLEKLRSAEFIVEEAEVYEQEVSPPPPLTTDAMLAEASSRLGMTAVRAMAIAQDLFEFGLITYHRTDSTRVSAVGRMIAREFIKERFGEEYFRGREWGKGGAHECIRPTRPLDLDKLAQLIREGILRTPKPMTRDHYRLYDLIFRRFIASQMIPAKVRRLRLKLRLGDYSKEIDGLLDIAEDGFNLIYPIEEERIPELKPGERLRVVEATHVRKPSVPLFSQGDLVQLMKTKRIGRPSTYAKIIATLLERRYVIESKKRRRLVPTKLGIKVYEYLSRNYAALVSEERTRKLEELMDEIEAGLRDYNEVIRELYSEVTSQVKGLRERGQ